VGSFQIKAGLVAFRVFSPVDDEAPLERSTGPLNLFLNLLIMDIYHIFVKPKKTL
jgi:hypothetical protein